jgi:hypothetical protein
MRTPGFEDIFNEKNLNNIVAYSFYGREIWSLAVEHGWRGL